jgi:hypothetical protein
MPGRTQSATQLASPLFYSRSHDALIRVYDEASNVIETHEEIGEFQKLMVALTFFSGALTVTSGTPEGVPPRPMLAELLAQPTAESAANRSSASLIRICGVAPRIRCTFTRFGHEPINGRRSNQ